MWKTLARPSCIKLLKYCVVNGAAISAIDILPPAPGARTAGVRDPGSWTAEESSFFVNV